MTKSELTSATEAAATGARTTAAATARARAAEGATTAATAIAAARRLHGRTVAGCRAAVGRSVGRAGTTEVTIRIAIGAIATRNPDAIVRRSRAAGVARAETARARTAKRTA